MQLVRSIAPFLGIGLAVFLGWKHLSRSGQEVAVLHAPGHGHDTYASVWVVDDRPFLWIRAERPTQHWLGSLRANPNVMLRRRGARLAYRATPFDDADARRYVDGLFRAKYGGADWVRSLGRDRDTVPVRLEPR